MIEEVGRLSHQRPPALSPLTARLVRLVSLARDHRRDRRLDPFLPHLLRDARDAGGEEARRVARRGSAPRREASTAASQPSSRRAGLGSKQLRVPRWQVGPAAGRAPAGRRRRSRPSSRRRRGSSPRSPPSSTAPAANGSRSAPGPSPASSRPRRGPPRRASARRRCRRPGRRPGSARGRRNAAPRGSSCLLLLLRPQADGEPRRRDRPLDLAHGVGPLMEDRGGEDGGGPGGQRLYQVLGLPAPPEAMTGTGTAAGDLRDQTRGRTRLACRRGRCW